MICQDHYTCKMRASYCPGKHVIFEVGRLEYYYYIRAESNYCCAHASIYSCYRVVMIIEIDHNDDNNKNNIYYKCFIIVNVLLNSCSKNTHRPCEDNAIARIIRTRKTHREQYTTAAVAAAAPVQRTVL